jgi:uncharacterized BrkB/YihY/UPF0761 family membrane protein
MEQVSRIAVQPAGLAASASSRQRAVMKLSLQYANRRLYIEPSSRSFVKTLGTLFLAPLVIGLGLVVRALSTLGREDFAVLQWCLAVLAVLLAGLAIAALLNFAAFAPVYWLLGRQHSKKIQTLTKHDPEA